MFRHKKKLGQNFLVNSEIINKIVELGNINQKTNIVEIGPGAGNLTLALLKKNPKKIHSIEFDKDLKNNLENIKKNYGNFSYEISDALKVDESKIFNEKIIIYGNLPYNISVPLLIKWISTKIWPPYYDKLILMFQKEVAEKIIAQNNSKKYGRISILCATRLNVKFNFNVNKENFFPQPKINSSVLTFTPKKVSLLNNQELSILSQLTAKIFNNKRKMIGKSLKKIFTDNELIELNFEKIAKLRPENLDNSIYYKMVKLINKRQNKIN